MEASKVRLDKFDNSWYHPGGSSFKRIIWYFVNILFFTNPLFPFSGLKCTLLRNFGAKVGKGVTIKPAVNIKYPWKLSIGNHVWLGENVWIDNLDEVEIHDHVCVSQGAMLLCGSHNYKNVGFDLITGKIVLEYGSWVGAKAVVAPGVRLLEHSVLAVNSVATSELKAYGIYQGNPAVLKRERKIG